MTRLRQMMLEELQRRNYSKSTTRYYLQAVASFARYFGKSPDMLGPDELRSYQAYLLRERKLAVGTVIARVAALLRGLGYRGYFIFQHQLKPIEQFDRQRMQNPANYPDLKAGLHQRERFGRYIYNFLFFPRGERDDTLRRIKQRIASL